MPPSNQEGQRPSPYQRGAKPHVTTPKNQRAEGPTYKPRTNHPTLPATLNRSHPRPDLRPPKQRNSDIPVQLQRIALGHNRPPVRMARLRIIQMPILQMVGIARTKSRPNHQPAQRPPPQRSIRVLLVRSHRSRRLQLHELQTGLRPTPIHPHHRPRGRLPIPRHTRSGPRSPRKHNQRQNPKPSHHPAQRLHSLNLPPLQLVILSNAKDPLFAKLTPTMGAPFIAQHLARWVGPHSRQHHP